MIKDKKHPLANKKGWIEMLYTNADGKTTTRALTRKERELFQKSNINPL